MQDWVSEIPGALGLNGGEPCLCASQCPQCRKVAFPPMKICPACLDPDHPPQNIYLEDTGNVQSFSVAQIAPPGFEVPHVQAYVRMPEGVKIFSILVDCQGGEAIKTGIPVRLATKDVGETEDGRRVLAYRFKPLSKEEVAK